MPEITPAESQALRTLIARDTGLSFDSSGLARLHSGVRQRLAARGCASVGDYVRLLASPQETDELVELIDLITVPETRFFRDQRQFEVLQQQLLPELARVRRAAGAPPEIRLWSAACATGEEAYSLAMVALEALPGWRVQVLATDISQRALRIAARGHYPVGRLDPVPPVLRTRYFERHGADYVAAPHLRAAVTFQRLNLTAAGLQLALPPPMDVILCENVLIYLEPAAVARLAATLHTMLRADGYLLLSASESLWRTSSQFVIEVRDGVFLHRKAPAPAAGTDPVPDQDSLTSDPRQNRHDRLPLGRQPDRLSPSVRARGEMSRDRPGPMPSLADRPTPAATSGTPPATSAAALLAEAQVLADRGAFGAARALATRACAAAPLDARAHALDGMLAAQLGDLPAAVRALERAVYLDPTLPQTYYQLGTVYRRLGHHERAQRALRQALRLLDRQPATGSVADTTAVLLAEACRRLLQAP